MSHDVFISHSSKDKTVADAVCTALEVAGIRCWIAPRDIRSGEEWPEAIVNAIKKSRFMILIFSKNSNQSKQVANELTLAIDSEVIVLPFKIDDITPKGAMQYYLTNTHWLDAMNPPTAKQIKALVETVKALFGDETADPATFYPDDGIHRPADDTATDGQDGLPAIIKAGWFWPGVILMIAWLFFNELMLSSFLSLGWGDYSWNSNYFTFISFSLPSLIPALFCIRRGMIDYSLSGENLKTIPVWWWILPVGLALIGGLIAWLKHRYTTRNKAVDMLMLGVMLTPFWTMPLFILNTTTDPGTDRIETVMELIGNWPTSRELHNVYVSDDNAYLANGGDGLVILDIADPSNPQRIGVYPLENAINVIVADKIAYVVEQGQVSDGRALNDMLIIIDVSDPSNPRKLGEYTPDSRHIHRSLNNLAVDNNLACLPISDRMIIVDISTPSKPETIGEFTFSSNISSPGVSIADNIAYVQANRLHVVDVSDPAKPVEIGGFDSGWGSGIVVANKNAYIAGWDSGLSILDVSTPSRPLKLGHYRELVIEDYNNLPPGTTGRQTLLDVAVSDNVAYMTFNFGIDHSTWIQILKSGIVAFDVTDPSNPEIINVYSGMDEASGIFVLDNLIFVTDKTRGLYIFSKQ